VLRFPLSIFFPPISPHSPPSTIWGWYNRPVVAAVISGLSLTPLTIKIKIIVVGFPQRRPGFKTRSSHKALVVEKAALGIFSPSTSVSPANPHSTD
jgi:hypothetical protein